MQVDPCDVITHILSYMISLITREITRADAGKWTSNTAQQNTPKDFFYWHRLT